jgi:UDP-GlcNAc:undecaprenyl-phosphate GlcNAc-1-phosphate transferase
MAAFTGAALLSLVLTPAVRRAAHAFGALDIPDARKAHTTPVPRLGGAAIALAMAVAVIAVFVASPALRLALFGGRGVVRWGALGVAALAVFLAGAVDDVRSLPAGVKLALETVAAGVVVAITGVPDAVVLAPSAPPITLGVLAFPLEVLWIVTLTNAVNMTDALDGVAGGVGAICAATLGLTSLVLGHVTPTILLFGLSGALVGFLPHNFRTPRIFLGDSGSLLIGFLLGVASLVGLEQRGAWLAWPAVLAVGVLLAECGLTVTRRLLRALAIVRPGSARERFLLRTGRAGLFVPDRRHLPHRMREMGFAPWVALTVLYGITLATGALAVAAVHWPAVGPPAALVTVAGVLYVAPRWLYEELRLVDRGAFLPLLESRFVHNHAVHAVYDGAVAAVAFLASRALVGGFPPTDTPLWAVTGLVVGVTLVGFKLGGLYLGSYREAGLAETARAFRAVIVGGVLGAGAAFAALGPSLVPAVVVLFLYFLLTLVAGARFSFRVLEYVYQRAQRTGRRALIVGADRLGRQALAEMLARPELGFQPVGFVDDDPSSDGSDFQGYPVRTVSDDELAAVLKSLQISDLVAPVGALSSERLAAVGEICRAEGVRLVHFGVRWHAGVEPAPAQVPEVDPAT